MKVKTLSKKDFAWTKWTARDIEKAAQQIIVSKEKCYAEIKKIDAKKRTFENTIFALEASDYELSDIHHQIHVLSQVSPSESVRNAAVAAEKKLSDAFIEIEFDEAIYQALLDYRKKKEKLVGPKKKLFSDMMKSYKRIGFGLPKTKRTRLQRILKETNKLCTDFQQNVNKYEDHIVVTKEQLNGLPSAYIGQLKKGSKKGTFKVSLDYPNLHPYLAKAINEKKRKELSEKASQRGGGKNLDILKKVIALRKEKAALLGYKNHASYAMEIKTAKSPERALKFIADLQKKIKKGVQQNHRALREEKRAYTKNSKATLESHDISFYSDQILQKKYALDSELIREYFPLETVKKGIFKIYSILFSVSFHRLQDYALWHKDAELYEIKERGKTIAYFILDLHPRPSKYGHAMMAELHSGRQTKYRGGEYTAPLTLLVCNFPKSIASQPSLLSHGEVETFFHEFGHLMHDTLTKARFGSQAGVAVAYDFVEAPSQMLEHWVWDKEMLKILSKHHKTGQPLSESLLEKMLQAKLHQIYYFTASQLTMSEFDLILHTKGASDVTGLYKKLAFKNLGVKPNEKTLFPAGFAHLTGGYDAGYYGYMWSKVFGDDMFSRFKKEGLLNKKTGMDYRKHILEKGSSEEELNLLEKFLKRKPNNKAFLKEIGL